MRFLAGLLFIALTPLISCGRPVEPAVENRISVHGFARLPMKPDRVSFSAGVETRDDSAAVAFRENATRVRALMATLKERGVADQDMQTSRLDLDITPPRGRTPARFKVSNAVTVVRERPEEAGALIQAAVQAGANDVGGLRFFVADCASFQGRGLSLAFKDARAKAEILAEQAGRTLGGVLSMTDQTAYQEDDFRAGLRSLGYIGSNTVAPGTEQTAFAVTVVFELR